MTTVRMIRKPDGVVIQASGHADFAVRGRDIVCAGISALVFGTAAYLAEVVTSRQGIIKEAEQDTAQASSPADRLPILHRAVGDGRVFLSTQGFPDGIDQRAADQLAAGIALIARTHPGNVRLIRSYSSSEK